MNSTDAVITTSTENMLDHQPIARGSGIVGAVFLMATSAIGPGFITQTAKFTVQLGASFACAISGLRTL